MKRLSYAMGLQLHKNAVLSKCGDSPEERLFKVLYESSPRLRRYILTGKPKIKVK